MTRPYVDEEYLKWHQQFNSLVAEFLDTDGNSVDSLKMEFKNAVENVDEKEEIHFER